MTGTSRSRSRLARPSTSRTSCSCPRRCRRTSATGRHAGRAPRGDGPAWPSRAPRLRLSRHRAGAARAELRRRHGGSSSPPRARRRVGRTPWFILSAEALGDFPTGASQTASSSCAGSRSLPRPGLEATPAGLGRRALPGHWRTVSCSWPDRCLGHSATDIRRPGRSGRSIRDLVPPAVERYIIGASPLRDAAGKIDVE